MQVREDILTGEKAGNLVEVRRPKTEERTDSHAVSGTSEAWPLVSAIRWSNAMSTATMFPKLKWCRLAFTLARTKEFRANRIYPLTATEAIFKKVTEAWSPGAAPEKPQVFFHLKDLRQPFAARDQDLFPVEAFFAGSEVLHAARWKEELEKYMSSPEGRVKFELAQTGEAEERSCSRLAQEFTDQKTAGEICLDFLSPMPFKAKTRKGRTFLDKEDFIQLLLRRFARLFGNGSEFRYKPEGDDFELLPYYWKYVEIKHDSASQPGNKQYVNGCVGRLYIKGKFKSFLPYLILGSELHAGNTLSNSQGYYKLLFDSPAYFERFPNGQSLYTVTRDVLEKHDNAAEQLSEEAGFSFDSKAFAEKLARDIKAGTYRPDPNTAFLIEKRPDGERLVERLSFRDLIVQEYLLNTMSEVAERIFEEQSIGFRKGVSRQKAIEMFQEALAEGFRYVIESDIEDFFPSIDLSILDQILCRILPEKDCLLKDVLRKCLRNGYVLKGNYHDRTAGIAQGSPLSPLLANLYLDSFDEAVEGWGVRLIRYADDFIILAKTLEQAEGILSEAESFLSHMGLKLKKAKTCIKPVSEGFQFLGIRFTGSEAEACPESEIRLYRKPLYITQPFIFLATNGDAVEIRKEHHVLETIPLRRISEIIAMERTTFSTALVRKCAENDIPLTITLSSGYYIATVKPDSKRYYEILHRHTAKYESLGNTEILSIAKEIAATKVRNYQSLFKQRYEAGQNLFLKELEEFACQIEAAADVDVVRGLEGIAARRTYSQLNSIIETPAFRIKTRDRKNPDHINSLMNFAYYLLFSRLNATVRAVGLNPYLGFLHNPEDRYESLVSDLVELFRARMDRLLTRVINLKVITEGDFVASDRGMYLTHDAAKKFLMQFEAEMDKKGDKQKLSLKEELYVQVQLIRRWAEENGTLGFYRWKL